MHVYQTQTFGPAAGNKALNEFERAASGSEGDWWSYFSGGGR
jgi:hypothetical protein